MSLLSKWLSRVFSSTTIWNTSSLALSLLWASLVAQMIKNPLAMWEPWIWSLDWENPLEKGMATHSSTLAWRIPWTEEPGWLQSMGSQRVGHDWVTFTHSAFFMVQLSHPYMTTGKTKALTIQIFVSKVMSLLFNTLSGFLIAFLSRSKSLLISLSAVTICSDFRGQENKICHCFNFFPIYFPWSDGTRCNYRCFLNVEF